MKYICPKCKNKYEGKDLEYCICGGKLETDMGFFGKGKDPVSAFEEMFGSLFKENKDE